LYPLDRWQGEVQSRPLRGDEDKKIPVPAGSLTSVIQPVA